MSIYIGLSSNLNGPRERIVEALERIEADAEIRLERCSSLYRTKPWGYLDQPEFFNAVARIETKLEPRALLERLEAIENAMGREALHVRWGPRNIDLDLLLYRRLRIEEPGLIVPHPQIRKRAFVLAPLLEIAPDASEPGTDLPYGPSLSEVLEAGDARIAEPPPVIRAWIASKR